MEVTEGKENIWKAHSAELDSFIVVPTNLCFHRHPDNVTRLVMGAGLARQAADRYLTLPAEVAQAYKEGSKYLENYMYTKYVFVFPKKRLIIFPTKRHFSGNSDINLIGECLSELNDALKSKCFDNKLLLLPRLGCGLGNLSWERTVFPLVKKYLSLPNFKKLREVRIF